MDTTQPAALLSPQEKWAVLYQFGDNLTELAAEDRLDPVIGRVDEIDQVIEVLSRRRKNNPMLVGDAGVGKTAIVEGLAQRIIAGLVPASLKNKQVFNIDLSRIVAGAKQQGEFEKIVNEVFGTIKSAKGEIMPFIDEVHMLMAAKSTLNITDILKPMLARGELHMVGATTYDEYQKYIERDPALERRFAVVFVAQPSVEQSIEILENIKEHYEVYHGVRIAQEALVSAAVMSDRYIQNRQLPDKAIDLLDTACSRCQIRLSFDPPIFSELRKQIGAFTAKRKLLDKRTDEDSVKRRGLIQNRINALQKELEEKQQQYAEERLLTARLREAKRGMLNAKRDLRYAQADGLAERVAEIEMHIMPELQTELDTVNTRLTELEQKGMILKDKVDEALMGEVLQRQTGIPAENLVLDERMILVNLETRMKEYIKGQDTALAAMANAVIRSRTGFQEPKRPRGSFLLLGASSAGKTYAAHILALLLFHDKDAIIRINMNEYQEKNTLKRLIGSPESEDGGLLLTAVRKRPYSVVLFDEIEKADPSIIDVIAQMIDHGILRDYRGRVVSFRNCFIVMTSNLEILVTANSGNLKSRDILYRLLNRKFSPQFLNKIDELVFFTPLAEADMVEIAKLQIKDVEAMMTAKGYKLTISDAAYQYIGKVTHNPEYGVQELNRLIKDDIKTALAKFMLTDQIPVGGEVCLMYSEELPDADHEKKGLEFRVKVPDFEAGIEEKEKSE